VTPSKFLPVRASLESVQKQAKKLAHEAAAGNAEAVARVRSQLPEADFPLSRRNAQLVLAREYGFAGWQDLRAAVLRREGKGQEWAAAEAQRAVHDNKVERLQQLIREYPALLSWRDDFGASLIDLALGSFGDSGDPYREKMFTRLECAEFLLDRGAIANPSAWEDAIRSRARGVLDLLRRKGALPRRLEVPAALGDIDGVRSLLDQRDAAEVNRAFLAACRFGHREAAVLLLDRCIAIDGGLGARVDGWLGRPGFIEFLIGRPRDLGSPWQTAVMSRLLDAIEENNLAEFAGCLEREPHLLRESGLALQVELVEQAVLKDRGPFLARMLELDPAILRSAPPQSAALTFAIECGKTHLVPLLTRIWQMPDDLCHAAGMGDFVRVKTWFDEDGRARLGSLSQHYPTNNPPVLRNLHWMPPNAQQVLDVAMAWACLNGHFEIAAFLLERGADINTDWSTREPASIVHECAMRGNYAAAQFAIDHGIDMTIRDFRWNATAHGWASHAAKDERMAEFLAQAERGRSERG
jgi:hypothetical protein